MNTWSQNRRRLNSESRLTPIREIRTQALNTCYDIISYNKADDVISPETNLAVPDPFQTDLVARCCDVMTSWAQRVNVFL